MNPFSFPHISLQIKVPLKQFIMKKKIKLKTAFYHHQSLNDTFVIANNLLIFVLSVYGGWYDFLKHALNWVLFLGRCQLRDKEIEIKEHKEQLNELVGLLRQSEARRKEIEKQQKLREQAVAIALATSASVRFSLLLRISSCHSIDLR